jgi:hypothetical protein
MGQIEPPPVAIVECNAASGHEVSGLLKVPPRRAAEFEVFALIVCMSEVKAPPEIEQQALSTGTRGWRRKRVVGSESNGVSLRHIHCAMGRADSFGSSDRRCE